MQIEQIHDLVALRVIVPDVETCYAALGALHKVWPPLAGRIKDYISSPKANGYRSLHTTVECLEGKIVEFQIKTLEMHQQAEYGPAGHLGYKGDLPNKAYQHFGWLEQLRQWKEEIKDPKEMAEHLRLDLFKNRIFVFSPRAEVFDLPKGATAIDFAFAVHSDIGEHCQGVKINGQMAQLKQPLKTGDKVEILLSKQPMPTADWLRIAKTSKALHRIRAFLEKSKGISFKKRDIKQTIRQGVQDSVATLRQIGKIIPSRSRKKGPQILITGESGIAVKMAKCCKPSPKDLITGFITQGQGVSVHQATCSNLAQLKEKQPQRIVSATWSE